MEAQRLHSTNIFLLQALKDTYLPKPRYRFFMVRVLSLHYVQGKVNRQGKEWYNAASNKIPHGPGRNWTLFNEVSLLAKRSLIVWQLASIWSRDWASSIFQNRLLLSLVITKGNVSGFNPWEWVDTIQCRNVPITTWNWLAHGLARGHADIIWGNRLWRIVNGETVNRLCREMLFSQQWFWWWFVVFQRSLLRPSSGYCKRVAWRWRQQVPRKFW
jgi:hypothetical protein